MKPGLERIRTILDLLANPDEGYPIIHVAGTNGKTSTTRMAAVLLSAHGITPGTFTSPHLQRVEERYEHGLRPMAPVQLVTALAELAPIVDLAEERLGEGITYFEITAALAHVWFAERSVAAAVVETGLGGRLDATNASAPTWRSSPRSDSSTPNGSGTPSSRSRVRSWRFSMRGRPS